MLEKMRLRTKMLVITATVLLGLILMTVLSALNTRTELTEARKALVRAQVENAYSMIAGFQAQEAEGKLTREEAQARAKEVIRLTRYGGEDGKAEYLYIWTTDGVSVMHPIKLEWAGKNMSEQVKDIQGRYTIKNLVNGVANASSAYVETLFPRPGQPPEKAVRKLQYVMKFTPWNWVVGTGIYLDDVETEFRNRLTVSLSITAVILLAIGAITFLISRSILRQVGGEPAEAIELMARASAGDLTVTVANAPEGSMLASFATMVAAIRAMAREIGQGSETLVSNAERISTASKEVSISAHQQADATSAMAAAIEQMTVSINHISSSAQDTRSESLRSAELAEQGESRVEEAVRAMNAIAGSATQTADKIRSLEERAQHVSSIAGVIKEIAAQTNLLALNAAIEAARAGEAGRGFAVVADEVRKLAERTSTATVEIEEMLQGIQGETSEAVQVMGAALPEVEAGVAMAENAAESLRGIRESAGNTLERINDVADATHEQSAASTSIAQKVEHIAQMVEETSAAMQNTAATAESLEKLAAELNALVRRFKY
ncbi:methyl-accepting chemotaxis protein [Oryzomicrobium terrae]|uniref:Methyl-accepting chemotaxis protein n=1 Tax=Oryzomicrobium terrae TaxID=1735038 RepID=A0A5C1E8Y2_9RHOO|nr:methyl-accepting chemotaxis protein [Oryzomicrobium terrae]QEL65426.1 methyl-accepting chemotaxis protein [Oryzomicrobium terrae]